MSNQSKTNSNYYKKSNNKHKRTKYKNNNDSKCQYELYKSDYKNIYDDKENEQKEKYSTRRKRYDSVNTNISSVSTTNNSKNQTPKTSFDISNDSSSSSVNLNTNNNLALYEKINRKYSEDNYYNNYSTICNFFFNNNNCFFINKENDYKLKYKTELCKYFEINGTCKYGDSCAYAHGKENLREKISKTNTYKTKKCIQFFENGFCPYGSRCQFSHECICSNGDMFKGLCQDNCKEYKSFKIILDTLNNFKSNCINCYQIEAIKNNIKKIDKKKRLEVFKSTTSNINKNEDKDKSLTNEIYQEIINEILPSFDYDAILCNYLCEFNDSDSDNMKNSNDDIKGDSVYKDIEYKTCKLLEL